MRSNGNKMKADPEVERPASSRPATSEVAAPLQGLRLWRMSSAPGERMRLACPVWRLAKHAPSDFSFD